MEQRDGSDLERQLGGENMGNQEDDYKTSRQSGSRVGGWRAASFILGMEFFERLSFLGIGLNLVTYLHDQMQLPLPRSANIVTNFMGTSYITCLLGGFIADTYLGRYTTTAIGCCIQLLGMIMLALTAMVKGLKPAACHHEAVERCQEASARQVAVLYIALYMIALGTGGIKSSLSGLGADQFEEATEEGRQRMHSFFNWFGASVAAGATLAITVLVYVQDNQGRGVGYAASAACMLISLLLFVGGFPFYHSKPPSGSAFTCIAHVFVAAWRNRHLPLPSTAPSALVFHHPHPSSHVLRTRQFSFLDKASLVLPSLSKIGELQSPWKLCSLEKVEEVKMVIRLLPILATTIVFWTANGQALTFSIEQGATLDRRLGKSFEIPPATFPVVLQLGLLFTIPFYDRLLVPLARKWRGNECGITNLQRIGVGLLFSTLAMVVGAFLEAKRLKLAHSLGSIYTRLPMSIFYLTPQYALVGIGEAFAYVGQLDFFYQESPDGMRSLSTGLCLSTLSFGLYLSSALVDAVNRWTKHGSSMGWLANNLDDGRLDYFYWFLSFLSFLSFLCFLLCAHWFKYKHTWLMDANDGNKPLRVEKLTQNVNLGDQKL